MWKPAVASVVLVTAVSAQNAPSNPFDKAPPDVSDSLKTRVNEFYQDHVDGKYRKAESLVADDSKDGFYAATKPALLGFTLGDIAYSDNYRQAKVTVLGKMMMNFMGMSAPQLMDVPFPSYWKLDGGKWSWYLYTDPNRMTPFGKANGKSGTGSTDPAQAFATAPDVAAILNGVKADKKNITLARTPGSGETVTFTNQLSGTVMLALDAEQYPGLAVKLDRKELKAGEKALLTIEAAAAKHFPSRVVRVLVKPSGQILDVIVRFQ